MTHASSELHVSTRVRTQAARGDGSSNATKDAARVLAATAGEKSDSGPPKKGAEGGVDKNNSSGAAAGTAANAKGGEATGGTLGEGASPASPEEGQTADSGAATPAVGAGKGEDASGGAAAAGATALGKGPQDVENRRLGT